MDFVLYRPSTGEIISRGQSSDPSRGLRDGDGNEIPDRAIKLNCYADPNTTRIVNDEEVSFTPDRSPEQIVAEILSLTQVRLDMFAQSRNYDSILSAATYATSAVVKFQNEGMRAAQLRDQTWSKLYELLDEVTTGSREMPHGYADIEAELPILSWL